MIGTAWAADAHGGGGGLFSDPTFWVAVSFVIFLAIAGKQIVKGLTKLLDDRTALIRIWTGDIEIHITADIAMAVMQYWRTTGDEAFMLDHGAYPSTLGYRGFPKSLCTSVNHQVCHGIPNDKALKKGDIVNIDITVIKDGWHGDTSRMFIVGETSIAERRLCTLTYEAMWKGIVKVKPGARLGDIGHSIQTFAENAGFSIVREFCGHGIGKVFHEEPQVLHYGKPGTLEELKPGMTFTIEPMINAGRKEVKEFGNDGWTIVTKDRSLSAQWEHTVLVTETGYEVLTLSAGSPPPPPFSMRTRCGRAPASTSADSTMQTTWTCRGGTRPHALMAAEL